MYVMVARCVVMPLLQVDTTAGLTVGRWIRLFATKPLADSRRTLLAGDAVGGVAVDGSELAAVPARRLLTGNVSSTASATPSMCGPPADRSPCRPATAAVLSWRREAEALGLDRPEHEAPGAVHSGDGGVGTASAQGTLDAYIFMENAADSGRGGLGQAACARSGLLLQSPALHGHAPC